MFGIKKIDSSSSVDLPPSPVVPHKVSSLNNILRRRKDSDASLDSQPSPLIPGGPGAASKRGSYLFFGRRKTAFEDAGIFKLSAAELAFLPNEVRVRLGRTVGHLPPAPSVFKSNGAVLFVDVSGFTKLGAELRTAHGPEKGAAMLAEQITKVLSLLTTICLDHGGDVSKFAGDALLCVWEGVSEEQSFQQAKECAIAHLVAMKEISKGGVKLDIHGGLARGSILHFHLGSADDRLRWYLMAGEAMAGAACLVDAASPGEIMCADTAETTRSVRVQSQSTNRGTVADMPSPREVSPTSAKSNNHLGVGRGEKANTTEWASPSRKRKDTISRNSEQKNHFLLLAQLATGGTAPHPKSESLDLFLPKPFEGRGTFLSVTSEMMRERAATHDNTTSRTRMSLSSNSSAPQTIVVLTSESNPLHKTSRGRIITEEDPILRAGLPRTCNVYIPAALRKGAMEDVKSEMRKGVSVVFVDVEDMALSDSEMERQTISDDKLDALNSAFVKMTRITHSFGGEVRDMLFDDKGCVFIAVFGAHNYEKENDQNDERETTARSHATSTTGNARPSSLKLTKMTSGRFQSSRNLRNLALEESSSEIRATKAAIAINSAVESARVGVSTGTCFVGMCGVDKRHDFIVIGHEVNMAARLMVQAERGQVVVSPEVHAIASKVLPFTERAVQLQKKNTTISSTAFVADPSTARRESFLAEYRYHLFDADLFVGRTTELENVEESLNKMCLAPQSSHSGCIIIEAENGMGKSAFVSRVRKMGKGRISICHGTCHDNIDRFQPWRSVLENLTGLRPDMRVAEMRDALQNFRGDGKQQNDLTDLVKVLPFLSEAFGIAATTALDEAEPFSEEHRKSIAQVGKAVTSLLVLGNAAAKRAGARGTLVIIENVEKSDIDSLLLMEYLIDHVDTAKRLAVCITVAKSQQLPGPPSQSSTSIEAKRMAQVQIVIQKARKAKSKLDFILKGLPEMDSESLVLRVLGFKTSTAVIDFLYDMSKGNPMHLTMLLSYAKEHGLISRKGGSEYDWTKDPSKTLPKDPFGTIQGVILKRFDVGLDEDAKQILRLAANISSPEFDAIFLAEASSVALGKRELTEKEILSKLRIARNLGFVVHVNDDKTCPESEHAWSFKHDIIAETICNTVRKETAIKWAEAVQEEFKALELRLNLGFYGRVDDFEKV